MEAKKIFFNSSMPRAGSTLMQNILAQNPRIYASATSGLLELLMAARGNFSRLPEFHAQDPEEMRKAFIGFCRGGLQGFYEGVTDRPVYVDKNRSWFHFYDWLKMFWPEPKIIICIRDIRSILSSMEKLFRAKRYLADPLDNPERMNMVTISGRVSTWLSSMPLGIAIQRVMEAVETNAIAKFHVVRFEDLTSNPKATMQKVYGYLGEEYFEHDFEHVKQLTHENDAEHGIYGEHTIREKVAPVPLDYNEVLGKGACEQVKNLHRGFYARFYPER